MIYSITHISPVCEKKSNSAQIADFLAKHFENEAHAEDIVFGISAGFIDLTEDLTSMLETLVPVFGRSLTSLLNDPIKKQYSQFAFIYEVSFCRVQLRGNQKSALLGRFIND